MAFPYIFEANFQDGTNSEWDSESDTGGLLDFPHYSTLARIPGMAMPYRGAFCMRVQMGDTNSHGLVEGDVDIADNATRYFRFYLYAHSDVTATADDVFSIFELQQTGGATTEATMGMRITAATNLLEIGIGDGTAPSSYVEFPRGRWVCVELKMKVATGGSGTLDLYLDGADVVALSTLTNAAAVGTCLFGTNATLATTTGTLLFAEFAMDDGRLGVIVDRRRDSIYLTKTGHAFVGPGKIDRIALQAGAATDNTITIYDTDTGYTTDATNVVYLGGNTVSGEAKDFDLHHCVDVKRGAYVVLAGTNPRCVLGFRAPMSMSDGVMRSFANRRSPNPVGA